MGKGKGKLIGLFTNLNAGFILLELKITREKLIKNLVNYLNSKLATRLSAIIAKTGRPYQSFGSKESNFVSYRRKEHLYYKMRKRHNSYAATKLDLQHY